MPRGGARSGPPRPGPHGLGKDARLRSPDPREDLGREALPPGARPRADARARPPDREGRLAAGARRGRSLHRAHGRDGARPADQGAHVAPRRPDRRRHAGARPRSSRAGEPLRPGGLDRRPRRGGSSPRPRLQGRDRRDPREDEGPREDSPLLGDDPARGRGARARPHEGRAADRRRHARERARRHRAPGLPRPRVEPRRGAREPHLLRAARAHARLLRHAPGSALALGAPSPPRDLGGPHLGRARPGGAEPRARRLPRGDLPRARRDRRGGARDRRAGDDARDPLQPRRDGRGLRPPERPHRPRRPQGARGLARLHARAVALRHARPPFGRQDPLEGAAGSPGDRAAPDRAPRRALSRRGARSGAARSPGDPAAPSSGS